MLKSQLSNILLVFIRIYFHVLILRLDLISHTNGIKNIGYVSYYIRGNHFIRNYRSNFNVIKSNKVDDIIEDLKGLTLLETSELVKKIEEVFNVSAQLPINTIALPAGATATGTQNADGQSNIEEEEEEEDIITKSSYEVVLTDVQPDKRMLMFRALKSIFPNHDLQQIKGNIDNLPFSVNTCNSQNEAEILKAKLEEAGGIVKIE